MDCQVKSLGRPYGTEGAKAANVRAFLTHYSMANDTMPNSNTRGRTTVGRGGSGPFI